MEEIDVDVSVDVKVNERGYDYDERGFDYDGYDNEVEVKGW